MERKQKIVKVATLFKQYSGDDFVVDFFYYTQKNKKDFEIKLKTLKTFMSAERLRS